MCRWPRPGSHTKGHHALQFVEGRGWDWGLCREPAELDLQPSLSFFIWKMGIVVLPHEILEE